MGILSNSYLVVISLLILSISFGASSTTSDIHENFLQCLSLNSHTYTTKQTKTNPNYTSILESNIYNQRPLSSSTNLKPFLIITPLQESHVQASVICSKKHGVQLMVRSGGHDYEGLSYVSDVPFVIVDMINLRAINVNAKDGTAWVQSGATLGELYYRIAEKNRTLGFPAAVCTTVGVGGQFSGGGYGSLLRKYGVAGDSVIDVRIVDAHGQILNKETMGEDLFWAIRGGGGGSFGVILSWKIKLVPVPPTVTLFTITKTSEEGATGLVHKWQEVAPKFPNELFMRVILTLGNSTTQKGKKTIQASFNSMYLGNTTKLLLVMKERFPELGLKSKDCTETSWVRSTLYFGNFPADGPLNNLLSRSKAANTFEAKSDYVRRPIPKIGLEGLWRRVLTKENPVIIFTPYGGRMNEISESAIPFPHRNGTLYMIMYVVIWNKEEGVETSKRYLTWMRNLYRYMAPFVSKCPREAYVNYRDLDLGQSKNGTASYLSGRTWGKRYFKGNYKRLVQVKSKFDPENFFKHEQSIPSIASYRSTY
ncbi:berberine bridge enzyme-like 15 [Papaver somniferum]|uniref:berberine bridge enzyme-like 15 n=1 Tax=Papaver somniferum TaxID=3469 RepID=UPI000E6F76AE|nr:berberine bridge enzyme-like 15 [Papaver somniferum]